MKIFKKGKRTTTGNRKKMKKIVGKVTSNECWYQFSIYSHSLPSKTMSSDIDTRYDGLSRNDHLGHKEKFGRLGHFSTRLRINIFT